MEVSRLTKYYGKSRGIKNVSFEIAEGEIYGFIGPNGAGKSTTIRTVLGLILPNSGNVQIFGRDAFRYGHELRREIGYLPAEVFYYDRMKVRELLDYTASFFKQDCRQRMHELVELMELSLERRIEDLSYGNRKKVGIVQGLLHSPKLIILDEPTSGLDPLMQQRFYKLIREESERGATVLFSSHILSEVQEICNRVAVIKEGSIIDIADIKLLRSASYKKVTLKGAHLAPEQFYASGITEAKATVGGINFFYRGDVNDLITLCSSIQLTDLLIQEPTLEEIFLHYYR